MAIDEPPQEASETSPLLKSATPIQNGAIANSLVPEGGIEAGVGPEFERHDSVDESRAAQFAGNSDVLKKLKYIMPAVCVGVFLSAADQTIIVSSYARIGSDLQALNLTSWIATAYFLTLTSFQPLYGKLSDIFGRKPCLLWAYGIFGLGSLFCGLARDINQLIAARIFQGIGGGGMTTVVSILMSDIVPLKDRGVWQGLINITFAAGAAIGAPLGGILSDSIGWRWAFIGQAPMGLIAFFAVVFALKLPAQHQKDWRVNLKRVDFLGAAVLIAAVFSIIFGFDRGSNVSWSRPICYVPLVASVILWAAFGYIETKIASEPFAPGHVIFDRSMFASYACSFFATGGWLSVLFYLPLFFQALDGFSATAASVRLLPALISGVTGSLVGGLIMKKYGKYYWLAVFAYWLLTAGAVVVTLFTGLIVNNTYGISVGIVMCAFGGGIGGTSSLIALIANAEPADQAVATACSYLFKSLGSAIGVSLSTTVVDEVLRKNLRQSLGSGKDADNIVQGVRQSLDHIKTLPKETAYIVRDCYGKATRAAFALTVLIVFGAAISSFFIREKRLSR